MSVINDMLRDLDKRQAPERASGDLSQSAMESMIEPQKKHPISLVLVVLLLCALALVWSLWFMLSTGSKSTEDILPAESITTPLSGQGANKSASFDDAITPVLSAEALEKKEPAVARVEAPNHQLIDVKPITAPIQPLVTAKAKPVINTRGDIGNKETVRKATPVYESVKTKLRPVATSQTKKVEQTIASRNKPSDAAVVSTKASDPALNMRLSPSALDQKTASDTLALFEQGDARLAYRTLYDFIASHEIDTKSRTVLASHLLQDDRLAEAGDVLVAASVEHDPDLRQIKARWYAAQGEQVLALHTLSTNLPKLEEHPDYYVLLASYYQRFGYSAKALGVYTQLVQFDDEVSDWWAGMGISSDRIRQWPQAKYAYQQALQLPGLNPQLIEFVKRRRLELDNTQSP